MCMLFHVFTNNLSILWLSRFPAEFDWLNNLLLHWHDKRFFGVYFNSMWLNVFWIRIFIVWHQFHYWSFHWLWNVIIVALGLWLEWFDPFLNFRLTTLRAAAVAMEFALLLAWELKWFGCYQVLWTNRQEKFLFLDCRKNPLGRSQ